MIGNGFLVFSRKNRQRRVLKSLSGLEISWKNLGSYSLKCRCVPHVAASSVRRSNVDSPMVSGSLWSPRSSTLSGRLLQGVDLQASSSMITPAVSGESEESQGAACSGQERCSSALGSTWHAMETLLRPKRKEISVSFMPTHNPSTVWDGEPPTRVIDIPVDFPEADKEEVVKGSVTPKVLSTQSAAVLVQAWYRGHLVRKTEPLVQLREIHEVKSKLREQVSLLSDADFIKRAQQDPKTKVWLTESVMDLLLRLDAIQGAHPIVRDIRKAATREVVDCQDSIDSAFSRL